LKKVLFVCGGNTCRSPIAKIILERMLRERGLENKISVDSAAKCTPTHPTATQKAKQVIKELYGKDLLASHKSKSLNQMNLDDFHLILTMKRTHKHDLPTDKTFTLKEYAGIEGNILDPYGKSLEVYRNCRDEIKDCLRRAIGKIISDC